MIVQVKKILIFNLRIRIQNTGLFFIMDTILDFQLFFRESIPSPPQRKDRQKKSRSFHSRQNIDLIPKLRFQFASVKLQKLYIWVVVHLIRQPIFNTRSTRHYARKNYSFQTRHTQNTTPQENVLNLLTYYDFSLILLLMQWHIVSPLTSATAFLWSLIKGDCISSLHFFFLKEIRFLNHFKFTAFLWMSPR